MQRIEPAADMNLVRELFGEYVGSLGVDLSFQDFEAELAGLPGDYDPILIGFAGDHPAGCVALRAIDRHICEMKRLYVRPGARGSRLGRQLAERIVHEARARGFARVRLDTMPAMHEAMRLYESLGFVDIPPYRFNPIEGSRFMELALKPS